jgi:peroxiredoxin Q/BCP
MQTLSIHSPAPDFTLPDQDNKTHSLSDYRGQWVLLYFYPKDDTPGCTKQALGIKYSFADFTTLDIQVLGVSVDSVASHKKFAVKYDLPFPLLADTEKEVVVKYDVWGAQKSSGGEHDGIFRTSFLIDPKGTIAKIYENVKPEKHAEEVLVDLKAFATTEDG